MQWFLVWILVVRSGTDFIIIPHERPIFGAEACGRAELLLEKQLMENPVEWGDFTSFSIRCERKEVSDDE